MHTTAHVTPAAARGSVRLTRRGRAVVLTFALLVALAVGIALGGMSQASGTAGPEVATETVVVHPGDTLWDIASERTEHGGQVREVITEIKRLNAMDSGVLQAGQKLRVPAAA